MDEMRAALMAFLAISTSGELTAQAGPAGAPPALTVGAMAVIVPEYPGADEYRVIPFPTTQFSIGSTGSYLAPSATGLGIPLSAYVVRTSGLSLAGEVGVLDSRPASRARALAGTDDLDRVATVGASLAYRAGPAEARLGLSRGVNDGAGFVGMARIGLTRPPMDDRCAASSG